MDFTEERNMILDMVAEGRITVADAKQLLDALQSSARKKEAADDFHVSPGMDFHIPEVHIPNMNHRTHRPHRRSMPGFSVFSDDFEDIREDIENEIENFRNQLEALKAETKNMSEEIKEETRNISDEINEKVRNITEEYFGRTRTHNSSEEDWES